MPGSPAHIGRYEIVSTLGQGGMGTLYLAWDPKLARQIAIKTPKRDEEDFRERFAREARSAAGLHHPHVVTIYDVGEHEGQPFIAMEYVQGLTLAKIISDRAPLSPARKVTLLAELCEGLAFAHKAGIVHRDVKPANLMVTLEGALKILDFGIARNVQSAAMTQAGMLTGTLNYMAPEQMAGGVADERSDIFAVGVVAYELLSYRQAFPGSLMDGLYNKIVNAPPPPLTAPGEALDEEIVAIVDRAIEKDPTRRYQDLGSMHADLRRVEHRLQPIESEALTQGAGGSSGSVVTRAQSVPMTPAPPPTAAPPAMPTTRLSALPKQEATSAPAPASGPRARGRHSGVLIGVVLFVIAGLVALLVMLNNRRGAAPDTAGQVPPAAPPAGGSAVAPAPSEPAAGAAATPAPTQPPAEPSPPPAGDPAAPGGPTVPPPPAIVATSPPTPSADAPATKAAVPKAKASAAPKTSSKSGAPAVPPVAAPPRTQSPECGALLRQQSLGVEPLTPAEEETLRRQCRN